MQLAARLQALVAGMSHWQGSESESCNSALAAAGAADLIVVGCDTVYAPPCSEMIESLPQDCACSSAARGLFLSTPDSSRAHSAHHCWSAMRFELWLGADPRLAKYNPTVQQATGTYATSTYGSSLRAIPRKNRRLHAALVQDPTMFL